MNALAPYEVRTVALPSPQVERLVVLSDAAHDAAAHRIVHALAEQLARDVDRAITCEPGADCEHERRRRLAAAVLQHVQEYGPDPDPPGTDLLVHPLATIARHRGDCASRASLVLALDLALGLTAHLVALARPCEPDDHIAVAVWLDDGWEWQDAMTSLPLGGVLTGIPCPLPTTAFIL